MGTPRVCVTARLLTLAVVWGLATGITATVAFGAPATIDCRNVNITAPTPGATLAGAVEIRGRALVADFRFYKVEYNPPGRSNWVLIGTDVIRTPVENGRLAVWQTAQLPAGTYRLRLQVVDPTGNYCEALVSPLLVANAPPTESPLPEPTETAELTVVPPQATPTIPLVVPKEVAPVSSTPGALPPRAQPTGFGISDLLVTGAYFFFGVFGMAGVVLSVAIVMYLRNHR
jgi:hypothetical protein